MKKFHAGSGQHEADRNVHSKQHFYALPKCLFQGAYDGYENHKKLLIYIVIWPALYYSVTRENHDILLANHRPGRADDSKRCDL